MSTAWLEAFEPNADALFDALMPLISDSMLLEIASADYGQDVERHLPPLKLLRDQRVFPVLEWYPAEV